MHLSVSEWSGSLQRALGNEKGLATGTESFLGDRNNVSTNKRTLRRSAHLFEGVLDVSLGGADSHRRSRWIVGCKWCRNGEGAVVLVGILVSGVL